MLVDTPEDLLYGEIGPRIPEIIGEYQLQLETGVTGSYDNDHKLYKIVVAAGSRHQLNYTVKSPGTDQAQTDEEQEASRSHERRTVSGPATIHTDRWGKPHRDDGPALEGPEADTWYQRGLVHREGAPAVIRHDGTFEAWYQHGVYHRDDGPALSWASGERSWYLHGVEFNSEEAMLAALEKLQASKA